MAKTARQYEDTQNVEGTEEEGSLLEYSMNIDEQERPPVLPIGEYQARITGLERKYGKESGRPYINVKLRIEPNDMPADFVEARGTEDAVTVFGMVMGAEDNPQSRFNMQQFCRAAGVAGSNRINLKEFLNKSVKVQIKHGKDLAGNDQPQVGRMMPL